MKQSLFLLIIALLFACTTPLQVTWSGYTWDIRNQTSSGPGPNLWSDQNVFVDGSGNLHLTIKNTTKGWTCAELIATVNFTYGKFEWLVNSRIDLLDKNVVVGLFLYPSSGAAPDGTNEIDIQFAQWANANNPHLYYTIWPKNTSLPYKSIGLPMNLTGDYTTHRFNWNSTSVFYESMHGHQTDSTNQFANWTTPTTYKDVIPTIPLQLHINLWLFQGTPPSNGLPVEVIIQQFRHY